MARTNDPVFQILVLKGSNPILADGTSRVTDLLPGQLGLFNYNTGFAINPATPNTYQRFFLAVGQDRNADGQTDNVRKSSGEYIELSRIHHLDVKCPTDCIPQMTLVQPQNIKGETEYALKLGFHDGAIAAVHGFYLPNKTFVAKSPCCVSSDPCSCTDSTVCSFVALDLVNQINLDGSGFFSAQLWDVANNVPVAVEDFEQWIEESGNDGACLGIMITSSCAAMENFCNINYKYHKLRALKMDVSFQLAGNLNVTAGTITEIQSISYAEGAGYDIAQREYEAGGWNGEPGPYRQLGLADRPNFPFIYNAEMGVKYVQVILGHDAMSISGWHEHINDMETTICIPCDLWLGDEEEENNQLQQGLPISGLGAELGAIFTAMGLIHRFAVNIDVNCCKEDTDESESE